MLFTILILTADAIFPKNVLCFVSLLDYLAQAFHLVVNAQYECEYCYSLLSIYHEL